MKFTIVKAGIEVAQAVIRRVGSRFVLTDFYVYPEYRRLGYGTEVLKKALRWADTNHIDVTLRVFPYGKKTIPKDKLVVLYKQAGFIIAGDNRMIRSHERSKHEVSKEHRSSSRPTVHPAAATTREVPGS